MATGFGHHGPPSGRYHKLVRQLLEHNTELSLHSVQNNHEKYSHKFVSHKDWNTLNSNMDNTQLLIPRMACRNSVRPSIKQLATSNNQLKRIHKVSTIIT